MIVEFSNIEAKLSNNMRASERFFYLSFASKCKIIGRCTLRPLKYCPSRLAHVDSFIDEDELVKGDLEILKSLKLINALGLGRTEKYENSYIY